MFSVSFSFSNLAEWTPMTTSSLRVLLLELLQVGQDVHAVDAAVGPEVEQDELALQIRLGKRSASVEPLQPLGKLRHVDAAGKRILAVVRLIGLGLVLRESCRRPTDRQQGADQRRQKQK